MNKYDQTSCAIFLAKYVGLALFDEDLKKRFTIYHEDIHFFKKEVWALIVLPYEFDGGSTDYQYFSIHDDWFDTILATQHNVGITLRKIDKDISSLINKAIKNNQSNSSKKKNYMMETCHTLQRKRKKSVITYSNHSLDEIQIILVSPSPTLTSFEKEVIETSFGRTSQQYSTEINSKTMLTHLIRHWYENKPISYPKENTISPPDHVALNIFSIELK